MFYQAADLCSILSCAFVVAVNCAIHTFFQAIAEDAEKDRQFIGRSQSELEQQVHAAIRQAIKTSFAQARRTALVTFGGVVLAFVGLAGAAAFFLTPSHMQLGFFASLKEFLDESADLASIFLFSCQLANLMFYKYIVDVVYQIKQANRQTKINFSPLETVLERGQYFVPFAISCIIVFCSMLVSFWLFQERSAVNFFKNSLDEVADVCSMLSVAVPMFFGMRIKKFIEVLTGAALFASLKND
jgi:hypothetical protein